MFEAISANNQIKRTLQRVNVAVRWGTIAGARDPAICGPMAGTDRPPRPRAPIHAPRNRSRNLKWAHVPDTQLPTGVPGLKVALVAPEMQQVEFIDGESALALTPNAAAFAGFIAHSLARHAVEVRVDPPANELSACDTVLAWTADRDEVQSLARQLGKRLLLLQTSDWRPLKLEPATIETLRSGTLLFCTADDKRWWILQHGRTVGRQLVESAALVEDCQASWNRFVHELLIRITPCTS